MNQAVRLSQKAEVCDKPLSGSPAADADRCVAQIAAMISEQNVGSSKSAMTLRTYPEVVSWLYDRIDYERQKPVTRSNPFRLERLAAWLRLLGSPQDRLPAVHIAGTKGKGSTAAFTASVLRTAGLRTGLYTSPHLHRLEERFTVDGESPAEETLIRLANELIRNLNAADPPLEQATFFEVTTLIAWQYFAESECDIVVLETGLGGRLDCTNICRPLATAITTIGLDHTQILGGTHAEVATEKAGIIKPGVPVISSVTVPEALDVIRRVAAECKAPLIQLDSLVKLETAPAKSGIPGPPEQTFSMHRHTGSIVLTTRLLGEYQQRNAAVAVLIAEQLRDHFPSVTDAAIRRGIEKTRWPLRFEIVEGSPTIVLDAAHNPDAFTAVLNTLDSFRPERSGRVLVFAAARDKDAGTMLELVAGKFSAVVVTRFLGNPRAVAPAELVSMLGEQDSVYVAETPSAALSAARELAGPDGLIFTAGSVFLAAEVRALLNTVPPNSGNGTTTSGSITPQT